MNSQLVAIEDLKSILSKQGYPYFIQLDSDGSCKVFLQIDENVETRKDTVLSVMELVKNKNEERRESEDLAADVRPLVDIEMISDEELETYPHFQKYFEKSLVVESDIREQLNSWFKQKTVKDIEHSPIITFYSYKGGVGRSTTMAIIARLLAKSGYNIAVLDFDLEAPGQLPLLAGVEANSRFGITDYLIHKPYLKDSLNEKELLKDYLVEIPKLNKEDGNIHLMPAGGKHAEYYIEKLAGINFDHFLRLRHNPLDDLFLDIQKTVNPDFILVDARTGFADIAGTLLFKYSDLVSVHVYNNDQNKLGIASLVKQISTVYDNIEEQSRLIWTNTSIPKWKIEQGKHEELQNYLIDQLKLIYGAEKNINSETSKVENNTSWKAIDSEYWELGSIIYNQQLDGASNKEISEFVEKGQCDEYILLKNKIISLVKSETESVYDVNLSFDEKKNIIKEIRYGNFTAEEDNYKTFDEFEKNFLLIDGIEELLNPNTQLVIGAKGTGKSALFSAMRKYEKELTTKLYLTEKNIVMTDILANPRYYIDKEFIRQDDMNVLNEFRKNIDINEMLYWKRFWKVYLWLQIYQEINYKGKNEDIIYDEIKLVLHAINLPTWMKTPRYSNSGVLEKIHEYISDRKLMDDINECFYKMDCVLSESDTYLMCLYDHLDKLFETQIDFQKTAISALLSFWDDGELKYVIPKIFLRRDIYSGLKIQNHTHWLTHSKEIQWTQNDLNRLIIKRTISHSPMLIEYIEKNGFIGKYKFDYKLGIEIPKDETIVEKLMNLIFGVRMGTGKKSGLMKNWFYNHLRDANDIVYPRDTIHLLKLVQEKMERNFDEYVELDRIISGKSITNNDTLGKVSEQRYNDLKEEYRYLEGFFENFKKCSFTFIKQSKLDIIEAIQKKRTDISLKEIEENIDILIEIGVLKQYKNGNIAMPDLYLRGFDATRPGPM